jgi:hypothetical protein
LIAPVLLKPLAPLVAARPPRSRDERSAARAPNLRRLQAARKRLTSGTIELVNDTALEASFAIPASPRPHATASP